MIEVAEEFIEAVHGRQMLVAISQVVLAELAGSVAERFHDIRDRRVERAEAKLRAGQTDFGEAGADRRLAGDEGGASGGATLLAVPVGEDRALLADAVDIGRAVAHNSHVVGADVVPADIVAHDEQDVGLAARRAAGCACATLIGLLATIAEAAASVVPPSRMCRRLSV